MAKVTGRSLHAILLIAGAASLLVTAGCSSSGGAGPKPGGTDSFSSVTARQNKLDPLFVQCLAQHNIPIWDKSDGNMAVASQGTKDGWYKDGRVISNGAFSQWFGQNEGTYPHTSAFKPYKTIADWTTDAATNGTWPTKVCGPLPNV
jgi:hypothetical protein